MSNTPTDPHDHGLRHDLPFFSGRRRAVALLGLAGVGAAAYYALKGAGGEANMVATAADGTTCVRATSETNGPFPADGTNAKAGQTVNALTESGVVRSDIRSSFGALTGEAQGMALSFEITLVDVAGACAPLADHAIYIWHCDALGKYSIYDLDDRNYLRGVGVTDKDGKVTFTTIFPGCYPGRWPHIHFEVFQSLGKAKSGSDSLLISQFAMPIATCRSIYADAGSYAGSADNLAKLSIAGDMVFGDNTAEQIAAQTLSIAGDAATGLTASARVGVKA